MSGSPFETVRSDTVYRGRRVDLRRDVLRDAAGREFVREVVVHPGAAVVVAEESDGRLLLLRQFRHAVGEEILELPAGTLEPGEDPAACAARELEEETGRRAGKLRLLGTVYPSPGVLSEVMWIYHATALQEGTAAPDTGEELAVLSVTREEARRMVGDGRIRDLKTLAGIALATGAFR